MKEVDGMLIVVDNSTSQINITAEDIKNIQASTASIRKKIIN